MYDQFTLTGLARRLQEQRAAIKSAKLDAERTEAELGARMLAAKVVTVRIDDDWRAIRDEPVSRTVDYDRFLEACRDCEIDEPAIVRCVKRSIDLKRARALISDEIRFDSICDLKPQGPRIRIIRGQDDGSES